MCAIVGVLCREGKPLAAERRCSGSDQYQTATTVGTPLTGEPIRAADGEDAPSTRLIAWCLDRQEPPHSPLNAESLGLFADHG